jgi:aminoglycoside 3-N-acetyltransferase
MSNLYYGERELEDAFRTLGVGPGKVVYVTGNLGRLGLIKNKSKSEIVVTHFRALMQLLGEKGTLVVPTHSFSICNTDIPFCMSSTPSESGGFTEYVRTRQDSVRQYHAFSSSTAIGHLAQQICGDCSSHAYGYHTPFQKMIDMDAIFVSVGMPAASSVSLVHQAEFVMGVPYRYTKEFEHPVDDNGSISRDIFYLFVTYKDVDIQRDGNLRIFDHFSNSYQLHECRLGLSGIQSFNMREFMDSTTKLMRDDIYCWLSHPPVKRPFRN